MSRIERIFAFGAGAALVWLTLAGALAAQEMILEGPAFAEGAVISDDAVVIADEGVVTSDEGVVIGDDGIAMCLGDGPAYGAPYQADLFYNYYVGPGPSGVAAGMYLAPKPVPPLVGHTYYTYQPFLPHEYMYRHARQYVRDYNGGRNRTHTRVHYGSFPFANMQLP